MHAWSAGGHRTLQPKRRKLALQLRHTSELIWNPSSGFADKRQTQTNTNLRQEDCRASVRALQNLYIGGAVSNQVAIAELLIEKQECELQEVRNKVAMDVRVAFYDLLL
jgi:hypothetical protein